MGSISPQSYDSAAKECYDLSDKFQTVYDVLQRVILLETSAMAGGYQAVKPWAKAYDERAAAVALVATSFARALQHFGDVLTAAGYNWKCGEYKANRAPNKGDPPSLPSGFPPELPYGPGIVTGVASSRTASHGLETDWAALQDKVATLVSGGEVPDGDTEKLVRAATAWKTFAQADPVYGGTARLLTVASGLERGYGSDVPKDIPNHVTNLRTLAHSLRDIYTAAHDIAAAVNAHETALTTMRSDMNTQFTTLVVVTAIQIGHSMVRVKEPPTKQKTPGKPQTPSERQEDIDFLNRAAEALAGPANKFLTLLSGFIFTTDVLTTGGLPTIAELPILLTDPEQGKVPTKEGETEIPPKDRYSGGLVKVNKPDPDADKLAERIGGESRVKYKNDPSGREFDAVSDEYVAQAKPANFAGNKKFRSQARATFDAAQANDSKVYYHFDGPPSDDVIRTLRRYSNEYGVDVVIDTDPL